MSNFLTPILLYASAVLIGFEAFLCPQLPFSETFRRYKISSFSSKQNMVPLFKTISPRFMFVTSTGEASIPFDEDFAESISKPLPKWFEDSKTERENIIREVEKNRERILQEFKAKYEISEEEKAKELQERWAKIEARSKRNKKQQSNWIDQVRKFISASAAEESVQELSPEELEATITTKEKWEKFWVEEEKQTGFSLPGFFEVFPELQFKWPKWSRRKDGSAIDCETDSDCPFPQACCAHPIIPGQQFCCTGWGQRIMTPAYARQEISSSPLEDESRKNSPGTADGKSWICPN